MTPEVSVVVGAAEQSAALTKCIESIAQQMGPIRVQLIVVVPENAPPLELHRAEVLRVPGNPLVPQLWGAGIEKATAPLIVVLSGQCIPDGDWLSEILGLASAQPAFAGYGGPILPPEASTAFDWAVYFSRYSAFMPPMVEGPVAEIAGDNAAYWKKSLDRHWTARASGFWETLTHHAIREDKGRLLISDSMKVQLGPTRDKAAFLVARLRHGMHYGSTRPDNTLFRRAVRMMSAPLLIPILMARVGRRARDKGSPYSEQYRTARPWLLVILSSWSLGEALGYLKGN